jgi:hypothetical protein
MLQRATGRPQNEILGMSYAEGCQLLHCHLLYQGSATRWLCGTDEEEKAINETFNKYLKR